jgi:hypothetical protein
MVTRPDFTEETAQTVRFLVLQCGPRRIIFGDISSAGALEYGRHYVDIWARRLLR